MYRKDADRHIVRDVRERLADLRVTMPWADWRMAVFASRAAHPIWYRHHEDALLETVEPLLRQAGVDMSDTEKPHGFIANAAPEAQ